MLKIAKYNFLIMMLLISMSEAYGVNIVSPLENNISANLFVSGGRINYNVSYKGNQIITDSVLGLALSDHTDLLENFTLKNYTTNSNQSSWSSPIGFKNSYSDWYNEVTAVFKEKLSPNRTLKIILRVYREGIAFRYEIPPQPGLDNFTISAERTHFKFVGNHYAWKGVSPQQGYSKVPINSLGNNAGRPLLVEVAANSYVAITESGLWNYARMRLESVGQQRIRTQLHSSVSNSGSFTSPWRIILMGETPQNLMHNHYIVYSLAKPNEITNTSWIDPGTAMRDHTLTYTGVRKIVDFSKNHNNIIKYVHWDAGWYGNEFDANSDPLTVTPVRTDNPEDTLLQESIDYAHTNGMKFMVYINHLAMENFDMDVVFSTYKSWGIDAVKFGFVNWGSQYWENWVRNMIKKAAKYELAVSVHDNWRPVGFSRTYPNLLGAEGYHGDEGPEYRPDIKLVNAFTRVIAGATDMYPKYYQNQVKSHAYQLALPVVFYNPISYYFWYDSPDSYNGEPEIKFWELLAATNLVWDETNYVSFNSEIGEHITVARRKANKWFIGSITKSARTVPITLNFLDDGEHTAVIYKDGGGGRTNVDIETRVVTKLDTISASMPGPGGYAIWIYPGTTPPPTPPPPTN